MGSIDASLSVLRKNKSPSDMTAFDASSFSVGEQADPLGFAAPAASKTIGKTKEQQDAIKEVTDFLQG
jgi:hypothetical protein